MPQASSISWFNFCFTSIIFLLTLIFSLSFLSFSFYCFSSSKIKVSSFTFFV